MAFTPLNSANECFFRKEATLFIRYSHFKIGIRDVEQANNVYNMLNTGLGAELSYCTSTVSKRNPEYIKAQRFDLSVGPVGTVPVTSQSWITTLMHTFMLIIPTSRLHE